MKKLFAALFALMLCVITLSACSEADKVNTNPEHKLHKDRGWKLCRFTVPKAGRNGTRLPRGAAVFHLNAGGRPCFCT